MNREYCERWLKSCLKKKVSITSSTIIMFLMTGLIMTTPVYGALNDAGTGSASGVAQGTGSNAVGADSIAIGTTANSTGDRTIAIGKNASTNNYESIAIGNDSKTTSNNNIAIGKGAIASGNNNSIAFGNGSSATGNDGALAVGRDSNAGGNNSVSVGRNANARGNDTVAVGKEAEVTANEAVAIGLRAKASADRTIALGRDAKASSNEAIAIGKGANASSNSTVALGQDSQATASGASALSVGATASGNNAVAISYNSKATATRTIAIGEESNASSEDGIALGYKTQATAGSAVAIGREVISSGNEAVALGKGSKATGRGSLALATGSNATGNDGYAIGWASNASAESTMAFGHSSKARKNYDIAFGREAETRDQGVGDSIAIGHGAVSGSNRGGLDRNGTDAGSVAIGTGAYTGVNRNNISLNSSVAIGAGAGAGFRRLDTNNNNMPVNNATDVDNNDEVLKKAFGVKNVSDYTTIAGGDNGYTNVDINEATALGRNARAIGDQAVAIGAQTIAGHGAVALGGNDITQFADKKYYKSTKENFDVTETIDHNQDAELSKESIRGAYKTLVGTDLDTAYKATYAQDGSVVLGAQAHSGTPLGTALGTNALIRKGAFGATAIGAGSQIQANAEAAVAIGMGSRADGSYAVAAGTASLAKLGDVAIGYHAEATGKEGAISIGQATKAQGDSSVMIGGANIASAASQNTSFISEKLKSDGTRDSDKVNITEKINNIDVIRQYTYVKLEDKTGTIADAYATLTGTPMNTQKLEYNKAQNKNGHASTSVGVHSLAKGDLASAFGASSRANAIGALALGTGAQALVQNSVAIGTGSVAGDASYQDAGYNVATSDPVVMGTRQLQVSYDKDGKIVSDSDTANIAYTFKWAGGKNTSPGDIVSFGTKGAERQLKHVAAGRIAENSTDAVNGSQLNAIIERFVGDKIKYFSVKSDVTGNHYNNGATGKDSIAIGPDAAATKDNATATGNKSKASEENATAYGYNTEATGKSSVALGTSAIKPGTTTLVTTEASGENSTALGVASKAKGLNSVALGYGVEADKDFATAIGSEAKVTADKGIAIGKGTSVTAEGGIALGADSVASVAGTQTGISVDGDVDSVARTNVYADLKNNVNNSKISGANGAVSVGSSTATRQIVNLAAGTNDTDAVNVAQLKSVNLAFKGNTGTGDVRLYDQRLSVVSSNTDLLTVEASDKTLTFTPKTATLNIDNTTGSTKLGKVVAPTTDGLVKASELANTLNDMYWNVATSQTTDTGAKHTGDSIAPVKLGETVNFIAGEHVTIGQNGRKITISMKDALTQVQLNNAIQQTFGNGKNTTLTTDSSGMKYSLNDDIKLTTVTTGSTVVSDGKVAGLNSNLTNTEDGKDSKNNPIPVTNATPNTLTSVDKTHAATVGDVLNSGWNLQNNGTAKDFVRPYDTVNFVDGVNTKAVVTTDEAGKVSNVTYNVVGLPIKYTDNAGNPVKKVGDNYYKTDEAGNVLDKNGNPVTKYDTNGNPLNANDTPVAPVNDVKTNLVNAKPEADKTGTTDPTTLGNVKSGLDTIKTTNGTNPIVDKTVGLVNLDEKDPTTNKLKVSDNNAATVGDLRNMGWVVSAEGNSYSDQVKNANEVNFVGKNGLIVTGKTEANGVRTITIENSDSPISYTDENGKKLKKVGNNFYPEDAVVNNGNVYPEGSVVIDGNVYPAGTTKTATGNIVKPDGSTASVATPVASTPSDKVKATLNSVTTANKPTTLSNVGSNLKQVQDPAGTTPGGVKNPDGTPVTVDGTPTGNPVTITNKAPYTAKEAADIVKNVGNNAATVGDVLNAGWNLQGNGKAVDFVKPYDTVNFRDGGNTTVTYDTDGATSHMQVNVTGLPVTNTITDPTTGKQIPLVKVGDTYYPANADGTPNIQKDANGNPANGYTIADNGEIYKPGDITFPVQPDGTKIKQIRPGATPVTINSNMSNPNVPTDSKNAVNTPTQLGNVANGAKTHNLVSETGGKLKQANDGNYYPEDKVNPNGSLAIDAGPGMTYPPVKPIEMGNDGKWYEKDNLDPNGNPKPGVKDVPNPLKDKSKKSGLIDFANSNPNNVATVGDLRNMGWVVSSDKTTGDLETAYNDQVRNANEVKFVGTGMATVSGKTVDGVRTITVDVNAQKTIEEAQVPVVYTDENGNKLTKIGDKFYNKAAVPTGVVSHNGDLYPAGSVVIGNKVYPVGSRVNGAGNVVDGAGNPATEENPIKEVQKNKVKASMNSGDGKTNNPTVLSNVGSNLKQVVDPNGTTPGSVKNPDGTPVTVDGNPVTTNKAPYTAKEIANMFQPHELNDDGTTKVDSNGKPVANKNYVNPHNAATVGDVLNTGWNLQNNGEARDFVKPYDTVNFVNGGNTTAVVTTDANGTTSHVTYNVTGLPVTYTNEAGKPVSKVGDNYYVVNDKGQPLQDNGTLVTKYNSKGNPLNDDGTPVTKQDTTTKPLKTNLVNPNVATVKQTTTPTQLGNVANGAGVYDNKVDDKGNPLTKVDGKYYTADKFENSKLKPNVSETTPNAANSNKFKGLTNLTNAPDSNVATVGDLRNMGWVVSSDKTTGNLGTAYNDQVRNANEVKFVGKGTATVSGKTDDKGVRTITVEVNDQVSTNNAVTPVVYTDKDGNQVYPTGKKDAAGNKIFNTKPDGSGQLVTGPVKTTINGPKDTTTPTTLSNVEGNLDGAKTGTTAPTTNHAGVDTTTPTKSNYVNPHNAATVGDVLNAGWNLQNNGTAKDFVKPYDTINFINGKGTVANVETAENRTSSTVTFNIDNGTITYENGLVKGSDKTALDKAVTDAQTALTQAQNNDTAGSTPATQAALKAAQDALTKAQNDKANVGNKVATVENVVEAINNSGFTLKADKTDGENLTTDTKLTNGELIKPGSTVTMKAGKNMTVKQEVNGNITYATKDDVEFNTVKVGAPETYKETATGDPVIKGKDGNFYKPADINNAEYIDGKYYPAGTVKNPDGSITKQGTTITATPVASIPGANVTTNNNAPKVNLMTEAAKTATNNGTAPTTALNVSSTDGKPTQIRGVGSVLNSNSVETSPNGTATTGNDQPKLVDLNGTKDKPLAETVLNSVATVRDLANMGWVVSSDKATGNLSKPYKDVVKNANEVKFVGKNGIQVSGLTDDKGVRTLTFEMEPGEVTPTEIVKTDDNKKLVKVGDKAYKPEDIGTDGQPKQGTNPVGTIAKDGNVYNAADVDNKGNVITQTGQPAPTPIATNKPNNGAKFVTGNQVADAIEKSGFVVGKNNKALLATDFENKDEKVNPNDELRFADGDNTNVKLATKDVIDATGKVKTVTTVKVDVVDLPVKYTDADGNVVKKGENGKYYDPKELEGKVYDPTTDTYKNADGTTLATQPTPKNNIVSSLVNPNDGKDGKAGTPSTLTNVANGAKTFEAKADANGNPLIKVGTDYYTANQLDKNGQPKAGETPKTPTQDIKMGKDGKWYPADKIEANGTPKANAIPVATPVNPGKAGLVDFSDSNFTNVATVGDLQNMGWVVGTPDNNYNDQVRNANKVDFKGENGIEVKGETTDDGTRKITVGIKEGTVTNQATVNKADGTKVDVVVMDGKYYERDKDTGKPKYDTAGNKVEVTLKTGDKVENNGSRFVTGNTVATAIQESGWNVGKADAKDVTKAFEKEAKVHDKVNPNDNVKFVDGDNTTVSMVTIDSKDEAGTKVATTYIKTDINRDIHIDSVTTGGKITNNAGDTMMLGNDGKYYPAGSIENNGKYYPAGSVVSKTGNVYPAGTTLDKDGNPTTPVSPITTPLTPTEVTDVKVEPKTELTKDGIKMTPARPMKDKVDLNKVVNLTNGGLNNGGNNITNVKGNLPQVNDGDKKVYDVDGNPIANKNNTETPIAAKDAANIVKKAGNNAATVGDVLNAGWNLQNNGTAKDFVKPYDTVNFVNGGNTTAVVTTDKDGTTSNVTYNITGLPISYTDKDGKPVSKVGDNYYVVNDKGQPLQDDGTPVTKYDTNGNPLNNNGSPVTKVDTSKNPLTINLVNPNVSADKAMTTPMKIGNIESGAKTFDAPKDKNGNPLTKANDGKWYLSNEVDSNGIVKKGAKVKDPVIGNVTENNDPRKAGLINFGDSKSNATNVATVGDLQNMGWVVSTSDTGYNDQVRNANVVDFKEGEGIKISGETLENGVRQIKVGIDKNVVATKQELAQVERLSSAGIAGVAAMANIPQINEAASNRYNIAVGVGYHKGEKALAVGISGVSDGGRVVYKASAALDSQKQTTVGLGVGYQFGKRDIEPNELDRFRAQLDLVNTQKSSLAQRLKEQSVEIEELKKQNKILNEKIDMILRNNSNK